MKILTKEEEREHNRITWEGGILGSLGGIALGTAGVYIAGARFPAFRQLSLPFRGFLVTGSTAFCGVVTADRYSHSFEKNRHGDSDYTNKSETQMAELRKGKDAWTRGKEWMSENRYPIVFGSWVASMAIALGIVSRNPYQTPQQKLVQARVYAQGLTVAVLVASFALESNDLRAGKGRWETVKVLDPNDPEHKRLIDKRIHHEAYQGEDQWMDMIEAQERKMRERGEKVHDKKDSKNSKKDDKQANDDGKGKDSSASQQKNKDKSDDSGQSEQSSSKAGGKS